MKLGLILFVLLAAFVVSEAAKNTKSYEKSSPQAEAKARRRYQIQKKTEPIDNELETESESLKARKTRSEQSKKRVKRVDVQNAERKGETEQAESNAKPEPKNGQRRIDATVTPVTKHPRRCTCDCSNGEKKTTPAPNMKNELPTINIHNYIKGSEKKPKCKNPNHNCKTTEGDRFDETAIDEEEDSVDNELVPTEPKKVEADETVEDSNTDVDGKWYSDTIFDFDLEY